MPATDVTQRFATIERESPEEYNFEHFRAKHLLKDIQRTVQEWGIHPGEEAPDFELPTVDGGPVRLSALRGRPVVLRFGSFT